MVKTEYLGPCCPGYKRIKGESYRETERLDEQSVVDNPSWFMDKKIQEECERVIEAHRVFSKNRTEQSFKEYVEKYAFFVKMVREHESTS